MEELERAAATSPAVAAIFSMRTASSGGHNPLTFAECYHELVKKGRSGDLKGGLTWQHFYDLFCPQTQTPSSSAGAGKGNSTTSSNDARVKSILVILSMQTRNLWGRRFAGMSQSLPSFFFFSLFSFFPLLQFSNFTHTSIPHNRHRNGRRTCRRPKSETSLKCSCTSM